MELVTLADINLNRVGSAGSRAFSQHGEARRVVEVTDAKPETLRSVIVALAVELGEDANALRSLVDQGVYYDPRSKAGRAFNVQGPNTSYSSVYATCRAFPALKVGGRYSELSEVDLTTTSS